MLWVQSEFNYNQSQPNGERIYFVMENQFYDGNEIFTSSSTPFALAGAIKEEFPEVVYSTRRSWTTSAIFEVKEKKIREQGYYVDKDFLAMFHFPFIVGNLKNTLENPNNVLITKDLALKYFDKVEVVGEIVKIGGRNYTIEGVLANPNKNSSLKFDYLIAYEDYLNREMLPYLNEGGDWNNNMTLSMIMLKTPDEAGTFEAKIKGFLKEKSEQDNVDLMLFSFATSYLYGEIKDGKLTGEGRITNVRLFMLIAVLILLIACINFMNLTTAKAIKRAKEVGLRKIVGARRQQLLWQFMSEALFLTFLASIFALALVLIVLPFFNELLEAQFSITDLGAIQLSILLGVVFLTGLLAGSYPAFVLSNYKPITTLRGRSVKTEKGVSLRKGLVVVQFFASIALIIGTVVIYQQISFMKNKDLGYDRQNIAVLSINGDLHEEQRTSLHHQLDQIKGVQGYSISTMSLVNRNRSTSGVQWEGKGENNEILFEVGGVDYGFLTTMQMTLKEGRDFSRGYATDTTAVILNEEAVKRMNLVHPVGKVIEMYDERERFKIIGVVENFQYTSAKNTVEPLMLFIDPELRSNGNQFFVKINPDQTLPTLQALEQVWDTFFPDEVFEYRFLEQSHQNLYRGEEQIGDLAKWFSVLAILISCLGLLGLVTYAVARRSKEIGVRKVLGASVSQIFLLISKEFVILIAVAFLVAILPTWYLMHQWLQNFAYRI
ncbi:MAG: ABC transporter permease, partial [Bacteroidota bacterium]